MRMGRRLLSIFFVMAMCLSMGMTALATGEAATGEAAAPEAALTPEQQAQLAIQQELDANYALPVQTNEIAGWPQGPAVYEVGAIVMEVGTGAILYAKNIDEHLYPASITKILTALVALKYGSLTDQVTFSHDSVAFLQPGDSSIGMKEGNVLTLEQALHATLLASANEAAYAVGESVGVNAGQDYNWFIAEMNETCRELGGANSNFVNTNGLHDDNHYTCPRDMALIGRELFKYPDFFRIVQTLDYTIPASATTEEHVFQQKDKMLRPGNDNYYEYAIGGKTGYTSVSLNTLVTMADNGALQLVCVTMRSRSGKIYPDTRALLDYGFGNFTKVAVRDAEHSEDVEQILDGDGGGYIILPNGVEFDSLDMEITPDQEDGEGEATLTYTYGGSYLGSVRATLSDAYREKLAAKTAKAEESEEKAGEKPAEDESRKKEEMPLRVLTVILAILLLCLFILIIQRIRRRRNRRRRRR